MLDPTQDVSLSVSGASSTARIDILGPIKSASDGGVSSEVPRVSTSGWQFAAPVTPGTYDIRLTVGDTTQRIGGFEVAVVPAVLCATEELEPSGQLRFAWRGSGLPSRRVRLFDPVLGTEVREQPDDAAPFEIGRAMFVTPDAPGLYRLELMNADHVDITMDVLLWIKRHKPVLRAPDSVRVGETFEVQWIGKPLPDHVFRLIDDTGRTLIEMDPEQTKYGPQWARMSVPGGAGAFRLQYADRLGNRDAEEVTILVQ